MKILFIFTGGTIGSTKAGDTISPDGTKPKLLIDAYEHIYGIDFEYDVTEPYTVLSENCTGEHLRLLSARVQEGLALSYDGIIVTHGTDTLPFSGAAIGYSIGLSHTPVCFVSANYPIEDRRSNALDNLRGAVKFIQGSYWRGTFVVYRNELDGHVRVHRATRVLSSIAFSDKVYSAFDCEYGFFNGNFDFVKNERYSEYADVLTPLKLNSLAPICRSVIYLPSVVGTAYPEIGSSVKYILLGTYHSGTLNTQSSEARAFFADAKKRGVTVFAAGTYDGPSYETANAFAELGIIPVNNVSPIAVYIKLLLLCQNGASVKTALLSSLSGDIVPSPVGSDNT